MQEKRIEIRWRDLDAAGHVNNAVYLTYLEEVYGEWLLGTLAAVEGEGTDFVTARVAIDYRRELTFTDCEVLARVTLTRVGSSSVTTQGELYAPGGELAAEAEAVLVARDPRTGCSRPLTPGETEAFEREARATAAPA